MNTNNKYKILLVEDEATIRNLITTILKTENYQVISAETCELGQMLFNSYKPDLVILDLGLPDMDGNNFIEYVQNENEEEKENQLKLFYKSVVGMINELSGKYNCLEGLNTPEFKLMFIPLESCASYIYGNNEIITKAAAQNIIIVCPSTLLATLKIINKTWQQKVQNENLSQILKTATNAYDKLVLFLKNAEDIKAKLISTEKAFDKLFTSATGRGGFVKQIESLRELGIPTQNKVDEKYLIDEKEEILTE